MASFATSSSVDDQIPLIYPYSEVGGIGVLIGFASTTFLTVLVIVVNYLVFFDPRADAFSQLGDAQEGDVHANLFDAWILGPRALVRRWVLACLPSPGKGPAKNSNCWHFWVLDDRERDQLRKAFEKLILRLCDGHFIAGYTFLIGGFISLFLEKDQTPNEQMSYYHWKILLDLGWYSATTQLAGFVFLRRYLADRPVQRTFRIFAVGVFVALLIAASLPKMDSQLREWDPVLVFWENAFAHHGLRGFLYGRNPPGRWQNYQLTVLFASILASQFIIGSVELSCGASHGPAARLRRFVSRLASRILSGIWQDGGGCLANWWNQAFVRPLIVVFLVGRLYCDLYQSKAVKVFLTVLITFLGSNSLYKTRFDNALSPLDDDKWSFGQISAIIASAIPMFAALLSLCGCLEKEPQPDTELRRPILESTAAALPTALEIRTSTQSRLDMPSLLYRDYGDSLWRPWAYSLAIVYGISAVLQILYILEEAREESSGAWAGLRLMVSPYLVAQWSIMVLYSLYSSSLESFLNQRGGIRGAASRRAAWMMTNGAIYIGFIFLVFCSLAERSKIFFFGLGRWISLSLGVNTIQGLPTDPHWSRHRTVGGLLWYILCSALILYALVCLLICLKPLLRSNDPRKRENGPAGLPVWQAPRAATWPARQAWRDGQYGV